MIQAMALRIAGIDVPGPSDLLSGAASVVEATGDLKEWKPVQTLTGEGLGIKFTDSRKALFEKQYYRVKTLE